MAENPRGAPLAASLLSASRGEKSSLNFLQNGRGQITLCSDFSARL
jgi:hypothetical protein